MSEYIPNHLLANVLVRLPFESLIRSRCVSKSWRALIDSPDIIKLHFERSHHQTNSHDDIKIVALNQDQFYTLDLDPEGGNSTAIVKHLSNPLDYSEGHEVILVGSCNGLLCLMYPITEKIVLWNPWMQKSWELPSPPVEHSMDFDVSSRLGFGFESVDNDYKVVNLMRLWDIFEDEEEGKSTSYSDEFYIYGLKLNSWRRIWDLELKLPNYSYDFPQEYVLASGVLHWIMKEKDVWNGASTIVAFDLSTEEFRKMACPKYPVTTRTCRP